MRMAFAQIIKQRQRLRSKKFFFLQIGTAFPSPRHGCCFCMLVGLHLWPVKRNPDSQFVFASELRFEAGRSSLAHSRRVYVNHRAGDFEIRKAESRSGGDQFSARGDECATVINRTASFIAKQVRVNIADAKGPRPFQHKSFADLQLAKGEVAGAGIRSEEHTSELQSPMYLV